MNTIISHKTAFLYYRWFRSNRNFSLSRNLPTTQNLEIPTLYKVANIEDAYLLTSNLINIEKPQLLISNYKNINRCKHAKIVSSSLEYPLRSFNKIDTDIYISCAELLFYQLSQILNFSDLMLAGLELCGRYTISINEEMSTIYDINPVTTKTNIKNYLRKIQRNNPHAQSINKALYAVDYLEDNSFSPQESRIYIILCGPRRFGAYAVQNMKFNQEVQLSKKAAAICGQKHIYPDISNEVTKVAIEYDSSEYHDNEAQNSRDKLRINALQADNWKVINIVKDNIHNVNSLHYLALEILKANNQETRMRSKNFISNRNYLYDSLYFPNAINYA